VLDSKPVMNRAFRLLLLTTLLGSACSGARLSHNEIRKQVAGLGTSTLIPKSVEVRRIVSESEKRVIAETTVELAAQFERDTVGSPWHISAVRLGDQNWIPIVEFERTLNELRKKDTVVSLRKLDAGVSAYKQRNNGSAPAGTTVQALGDTLHPQYMSDLVLSDAWGRPIEVESSAAAMRFRSLGADGLRGTADDVLFPE
jgi:hypothetical protein